MSSRSHTTSTADATVMLTLDPRLAQRFRELSVRMEISDRNTILLRRVPTRDGRFNLPQTSLLVKRPQAGLPYVVSVTADLEYLGSDVDVTRAFRSGIPQNGWRTLLVALPSSFDLAAAMNAALAIVGFDGAEPRLPGRDARQESGTAGKDRPSLLERFGVDLTSALDESLDNATVEDGLVDGALRDGRRDDGAVEPAAEADIDDEAMPSEARRGSPTITLGRDDELLDALATLLSERECRLPLIVGPSGVGKSNLVRGVAARLRDIAPERRVVAINPNELVVGVTFEGEFENVFHELLREAESQPDVVLAIEHFELLLVSRIPRLLSEMLDRGRLTVLGTLLPEFASRVRDPLARRSRFVRLDEPPRWALRKILQQAAARPSMGRSEGRPRLDASLLDTCCKAAADLPGASPGKELALLEAAVTRARLTGATLSPDDLYHAARRIAVSHDDE